MKSKVFEESKSYRPFIYPWAAAAAQRHAVDMFWDVHQVELQDDLRQYNSKEGLKTANVSHEVNKSIIDNTLCLFTELDKTVAGGYTDILPKIKNNEIRNMMMTFAAREVVHQRAYALCAETFGFTDSDWSKFSEYAEMRNKLDVMTKKFREADCYSEELKTAIDLTQILLGEGIGLFAAFASLLNFKRFGLIIGFNDVNQWSLSDEQEHIVNNIRTVFAMREGLTELEKEELNKITKIMVEQYVDAEHKYIDLVYEIGNQEDLTKEQLKEYIQYLGEFREYQLGTLSIQEVRENPLPWMEWLLSGSKHDSFFEKRVTDYQHGGLTGIVDYKKYEKLLEETT